MFQTLKLSSIASTIAILAQAMALPNPTPTPTGLSQLARFDNDAGLPALGIAPINIYLDIFWKGMSLVETLGTSALPGLTPNSEPNLAAFSPKNVATLLQGTPEMTTVYDDSTVKSLTLDSFFYGCALGAEESLVSLPLSCSITVTGFNSSGKQAAKQPFPFVADGLQQQMIEAKPSGFTQVQYIIFALTATNTSTVALIDTVKYTVFST